MAHRIANFFQNEPSTDEPVALGVVGPPFGGGGVGAGAGAGVADARDDTKRRLNRAAGSAGDASCAPATLRQLSTTWRASGCGGSRCDVM